MIDLLRAFNLYAEETGEHWSCLLFTNGNPSLYRTTEVYLPVLSSKTTVRDLKDSCVTVLTLTERRVFDIQRKGHLCELISFLLHIDSQPPARYLPPTEEDQITEQLRSEKPKDLVLQHAIAEVDKTRVLNATMALSKALGLKMTFSADNDALSLASCGTEGLKIHPFTSFFGSDDACFQFSAVPATAILVRNLGPLSRNSTIRAIRHGDKTFKKYKAFVEDQPDHVLYKNDVIINLALPGALASLAEIFILYNKEYRRTKPNCVVGGYRIEMQDRKSYGNTRGKVEKYSTKAKPSEVRKMLAEAARAEKRRKTASSVADWRNIGMRDHVRRET